VEPKAKGKNDNEGLVMLAAISFSAAALAQPRWWSQTLGLAIARLSKKMRELRTALALAIRSPIILEE
jgi:hypothetical protein